MTLYLWLLEQSEHTGSETYDSVVVVAQSEDDARAVHPSSKILDSRDVDWGSTCWASSPMNVTATRLGMADGESGLEDGSVVSACFNG